MRARVTQAFRGVRNGQIYPDMIEVDEVVDGDLAKLVIEALLGDAIEDEPEATPEVAEDVAPPSTGPGFDAPPVELIHENPLPVIDIPPAPPPARSSDFEPFGEPPEPGEIDIPDNWMSLHHKTKKGIAYAITGERPDNVTDAEMIIRAELSRRAAAAMTDTNPQQDSVVDTGLPPPTVVDHPSGPPIVDEPFPPPDATEQPPPPVEPAPPPPPVEVAPEPVPEPPPPESAPEPAPEPPPPVAEAPPPEPPPSSAPDAETPPGPVLDAPAKVVDEPVTP